MNKILSGPNLMAFVVLIGLLSMVGSAIIVFGLATGFKIVN